MRTAQTGAAREVFVLSPTNREIKNESYVRSAALYFI